MKLQTTRWIILRNRVMISSKRHRCWIFSSALFGTLITTEKIQLHYICQKADVFTAYNSEIRQLWLLQSRWINSTTAYLDCPFNWCRTPEVMTKVQISKHPLIKLWSIQRETSQAPHHKLSKPLAAVGEDTIKKMATPFCPVTA